MRTYYVYIMASLSRALYTGVTNNIKRRVSEHKGGINEGFTKRYRIKILVYYETYSSIKKAIEREKQIKSWRREKRVTLIEKKNPQWQDLSREWYELL